jgi:hypothetical protein
VILQRADTHTRAKLTSRAAAKTDTAHNVGDPAGLHSDDILILGFLRIAIANQLFMPKVIFLLIF